MLERANVATDHQQLLMTTFKTIAKKHGMEACSTRSLPGVNGSGKHVNWSLGNNDLGQPARAGRQPARQRAVPRLLRRRDPRRHQYAGLLRASVASASNDHRLGANEAPPAIISIFLGDQLADVFEQIAKGAATSSKGKGTMNIGVDTLPVAADRPGRPQPHQPVRLHRQPVRVPRARARCRRSAAPMVMINTIMAEALDYIATELEAAVAEGHRLRHRGADPADRDHHRARCGRLQRRRLLGRVADRGRRSAACRTCGPPSTPCPS